MALFLFILQDSKCERLLLIMQTSMNQACETSLCINA